MTDSAAAQDEWDVAKAVLAALREVKAGGKILPAVEALPEPLRSNILVQVGRENV